ncbi:MAG: hypothetical protein IIA61_07830 [Candidatus Marinimicrobia bacterium]|nr:hypothetical protein [Candidatus Neomarinimicrobiota bacterium]
MSLSWAKGGIHAFPLFILIVGWGTAQEYPRWFLNPSDLPCQNVVAGYAKPSLHLDSSIDWAVLSGAETYVKYSNSHLMGGEAYWSTEAGVAWMGSEITLQYDSAAVRVTAKTLQPIDTVYSHDLMIVLLSKGHCELDKRSRKRVAIKDLDTPSWINSIPQDCRYLYAMGQAPKYYYEISSWIEAEERALKSLARSIGVGSASPAESQ